MRGRVALLYKASKGNFSGVEYSPEPTLWTNSAKRASAWRFVPRIVTVCRRRLPVVSSPVSKVKVQLPLLRCFIVPRISILHFPMGNQI